MSDTQLDWLEEAWRIREEELYPKLFGGTGPGIFALDTQLFTDVFKQKK